MKKLLFLSVGLAIVVLGNQAVFAKDPVLAQRVQPARVAPQAAQDVQQDRIAQRCQVIQQRFDVQLNRYGINARQHALRYERMQARLNVLVTRLNEAGKDTSELESALLVLDEKIQQFIHNATAYIESLKLAQEFACDEPEINLRGKVTETRSLLLLLRENVMDIRSYWRETLRPMIVALINESE